MMDDPVKSRAAVNSERLHDIDWLRVIAVLLLIVFHSTRPFDFEPWHARNAESSRALALLGGLLSMWRLPLLFLVSGTGTCFALGHRSGWKYARDRFRRLVIPLVAGIFVVVPPQVYLERIGSWMPARLSPINFQGSFIEFYLHLFEGTYPQGNLSWHQTVIVVLAYFIVQWPAGAHAKFFGLKPRTSGVAP